MGMTLKMKKFLYYQFFFYVFMSLFINACSSGYNKYADEYYEQGLILFEKMEYDRSIENFTKVLEIAPYGEENYKVYFNRGQAYLKNRQYDKAIYDLTKASPREL